MSEEATSWFDSIAPESEDNTEIRETLGGFENPQAFLEDYQSSKNYDWRSEAAGDDDKFKSTLERFQSIGDFANSYRQSQQKIRSGQLKEPLATDATDDEIKAYREANGIPLESSGYLENLPDGLVVGEEDAEYMADFMQSLHEVNAPPEIAHKAIEWYNNFAEEQQEILSDLDDQHHQETEDQLRQEWGNDYRQNVNVISALIEKTFGEEVRDSILNARDMNGRAIMNMPGIVMGLADLARQVMHPMSIPGQASDPAQTVEDEIQEIEKVMREDRARYNSDEAMQARLRQLYDIRLKHAAA